MEEPLRVLLVLISAYLVGAIPTAYIAGRLARGVDIRRYGSGNVGASNVGRLLGRGYFALVFAFDVAVKGSGPVLLARLLGLGMETQAIAGLLATIGHNWSPYLRFSGGRGLAVTLGALLVLSWKLGALSLGVAVLPGRAFRSIALWSGVALVLLPIWAWLLQEPPALIWYGVATLGITGLKRLLSNPGTGAPGAEWRRKLVARMLFDRDTWQAEGWTDRKPQNPPGEA